jgi:hypothetical protein
VPTSIQQVIDNARVTLNDSAKVRYPDAECFQYILDAFRQACLARPDLFSITGTVTCVVGVEQTLPSTAWFVIDVIGTVGGDDIEEGDYETLRAYNPGWRNEPAGPAVNWFRFPQKDDLGPNNKFYVTPPAAGGELVKAVWADFDPSALTITSAIMVPEQYVPALEAYIIFRAEAKDDEHVVTGRASLFSAAFDQALRVGQASEQAA